MSKISSFPASRSAETRIGFWYIRNPSRPDIAPLRIVHSEDWRNVLTPSAQLAPPTEVAFFIPEDVARHLGFAVEAAPRKRIAAPNGVCDSFAQVGPVKLRWLTSLEEEKTRKEHPGLPEREEYETLAYVWSGAVTISAIAT